MISGRRVPRRTPSGTYRVIPSTEDLVAWARAVVAGRAPRNGLPSLQLARGVLELVDRVAALERRVPAAAAEPGPARCARCGGTVADHGLLADHYFTTGDLDADALADRVLP